MGTSSTPSFSAPDFKSFFFDSGIIKEGAPVDFFIDPKILWMGAGVLLLLFALISLVLVYHWITYGYKPTVVGMASIIYFAGSFVIFSVILITLLSYSSLS